MKVENKIIYMNAMQYDCIAIFIKCQYVHTDVLIGMRSTKLVSLKDQLVGSRRQSDSDVNIVSLIRKYPTLLSNPASANGQDLTLSVPLEMESLITTVYYCCNSTAAGRNTLLKFAVNTESPEPLCWSEFHTADESLFRTSGRRINTLYVMLGSSAGIASSHHLYH